VRIIIKVKPNSGRNELKEISPGLFEARVSVPPEKGKANERVIELISKHFKIPKSKIQLKSGHAFKEKMFEISE
jgi:uncharacterized protein YggU (UPF0235/DUF167 family)